MNRRITLANLGIILCLGLAIGLLGWVLFPRIPVWSDSLSYFTAARNLLMGKGLVTSLCACTQSYFMGIPHPDLHLPGWPLLIAGFMWLTKTGLYAPVLLNILLTVLAAILVYHTVRFWSTPARALSASLVFLVFPTTLMYEFSGLSEMAIIFWVILSLFLSSVPGAGRSIPCLIGSWASLVIAYATRESSLLFLPLVLVFLRQRGSSKIALAVFGVSAVLACFGISYTYYSLWPGFAEARAIAAKTSLLSHTGMIRRSHFTAIATWQDLPDVSPARLAWDVLARKPLRLIVNLARNGNWYMNLLNAITALPIILAPFVANNKKQKLGLFLCALIIPALFTIYSPTGDNFIRVAFPFAIAGVMLMAIWARGWFSGWWTAAGALLLGVILAIPGIIDYQKGRRNLANNIGEAEAILKKGVSPDITVIGARSSVLYLHVLYHPDGVVIVYPDNLEDARLLNETLGTEALLFASYEFEKSKPYPEIESLGWRENVFPIDGDTLFIYTRPR